MQRTQKGRARRRGFTLMELMIVLGILVLLFAFVTPTILGTQEKADLKAAGIQIEAFKGSLEHYNIEMKQFPTTEQGLESLVTAPTTETEGAVSRWDGPYTNSDEIPLDPWGNQYQYEYPPTKGTGKYPDIWSYGPDGQDGTEDDICSWSTKSTDGEGGVDSLDDPLEQDVPDLAGTERDPLASLPEAATR